MTAPQSDKPLKPCTLWTRWNKQKQRWEYNHLSDGHEPGDLPAPKCPVHETAWPKSKWWKELAWMTDELVPRVVRADGERPLPPTSPL